MFEELIDLSRQRSNKEAIKFYIAYLIVSLILGLIGGLIGLVVFYFENPVLNMFISAQIVTTVFCISLYLIIYFKKGFNSLWLFVLGLMAGVINVFCLPIISMLIPAYLTTMKSYIEIYD